jgi:hypothetical protein
MAVDMAEKRVFAKFAEVERKALEVGVGHFLLGESQHFMGHPMGAQLGDQISG